MINNSIYASAIGGMMAMKRMEVLANNLANAGTPGFKADRTRETADSSHISREEFDPYRLRLKSISDLLSAKTQHSQGAIETTKGDFDVAIQGEGFFELQTAKGPVYTRAGAFRADREGKLVSAGGDAVMGEGGPIDTKGGDLTIRSNGEVVVDGQVADKLKIVAFDDPATLEKRGGTVFAAPQSATSHPAENYTIVQGALEMSNVNPIRTMVELIETNRMFDSAMKAIHTADEINQRSTTTVGKFK